ncbi:miaA protein [Lactobacillus selangorensis]|uniref:tRNA dimethylallyltransferase n=1 Tax=Lactobacillus selangorensis TaxID=81857 RepID=A0A0R2G959_9LACO|nr:tRNA (adenosine(37)-N6)-dimethylallyltransferase MiaA [Lactobacillus selangorensis]KRN29701.1 miaA protein [Lactobacillus selangorensis]KRN33770.1 miaA protein [Lactobacillus selangorensis]
MKKVLVIMGPTAVGKTALGIKLAQRFDGEIISGDALQVYRKLDIGTAKATPAEQAAVPHHLIDIRDLNQRYSAYEFQQEAGQLIDQLTTAHQLPIIVGGTGFYIQALLKGLTLGGDTKQAEQDFSERHQWQNYLSEHGPEQLWAQLHQVDPAAAAQIPVGNTRRVIRALEVYDKTGRPISAQHTEAGFQYDAKIIALNCDRDLLYERINLRVDQMMDAGLLKEARYVYHHRQESPQAQKGIGYKEFFPYFEGQISLATAVETVKKNSRHYAKRQLTWLRHQLPCEWFNLVQHPEELQTVTADVAGWLSTPSI